MKDVYDLVVIGGGAAGFFGALACADACPPARILIVEKAQAVLAKVRISGGGRCNVTQAQFDPARLSEGYPRGAKALRQLFARFQPQDTIAWFEQRGVPLKTEPDGRVFPVSDSSQTIINLLLDQTARYDIRLRTRTTVTAVRPLDAPESGFAIQLRGEEPVQARYVLLTTGGDHAGFELAQSLGHAIIAPVPSLFTFKLADPRLEGLAGLSVPDAELRLPDSGLRQRGPLLVTHWGISGPAVLKLSAWGARYLHDTSYRAALRIAWLGGQKPEQVYQSLLALRATQGKRQIHTRSPFDVLPVRLWQRLASAAGISDTLAWNQVSNHLLSVLAGELADGHYDITGKGEFKEEFVTCGGVNLKEIDFKTLQSRVQLGLYLAGEVLDIDGITGGYNFQNAWTTAWIAGHSIGEQIKANTAD